MTPATPHSPSGASAGPKLPPSARSPERPGFGIAAHGRTLGCLPPEPPLDPMDMHDVPCGLDFASFVVAGKWKPVIVYHLRSGPRRFRDLKRRVAGISARVLTQQLRELAATDVLVRHDHRQSTPRVDYMLTPFGMALVEAILPLCAWGLEHRDRIEGMMLSRRSEQSSQQCTSPEGFPRRGPEHIAPREKAAPDLEGGPGVRPARRGGVVR